MLRRKINFLFENSGGHLTFCLTLTSDVPWPPDGLPGDQRTDIDCDIRNTGSSPIFVIGGEDRGKSNSDESFDDENEEVEQTGRALYVVHNG
jgi:hypothetical protein